MPKEGNEIFLDSVLLDARKIDYLRELRLSINLKRTIIMGLVGIKVILLFLPLYWKKDSLSEIYFNTQFLLI